MKNDIIIREEYYLNKLDTDKKMNNGFLKWFKIPNLVTFTLSTTLIMSEISLLTASWIPSVIAIYLLWECITFYTVKSEIAKKCALEEMGMQEQCAEGDPQWADIFPDEPMRVTEEDRNYIMEIHVLDYKNMTFTEKIKTQYINVVFVIAIYPVGYMLLWFLKFY